MKNFFKLILVIICGVVFMPECVYAETFKDGSTTYILEERNITCLRGDDIGVSGMDEDNNLIFYVGDDIYDLVKVNANNECIEMTVQEKLDYVNSPFYYHRLVGGIFDNEESNNEYAIVKETSSYIMSFFTKTEDTDIVEGKTYFVMHEENSYGSVVQPVKEELNTYYEELYFEIPKSVEINDELTYYLKGNGMSVEKVENPTSENILNYYVLSSYREPEIVRVSDVNGEAFEKIIGDERIFTNVMKSLDTDEFYIELYRHIENEEDIKTLTDVYKIDGTPIEKLKDLEYVTLYHNNLFGIYDNKFKILNSDLDVIYETNKFDNLYEDGYVNGVYYLSSWDNDTDEETYYTMRFYSLLEGLNQKYNGKNLTFRFSGEVDDVTKVLLNDKELDKKNYTLKSGSTIVTLNKDYLDTLKSDIYKLTVMYGDVPVDVTFEIEEDNPQTFDPFNNYIIMGLIGVIGFIGLMFFSKKEILYR